MDRTFAEKFIHDVLDEVWTQFNFESIPYYYHKDVDGYKDGLTVTYSDIVYRCQNMHKIFKSVINDVEEILVDKDKIILRLNVTGLNAEEDYPDCFFVLAVFQITDKKISKFWIITDQIDDLIV